MIRLEPLPTDLSSAAPPGARRIQREFQDPYLELVRLLNDASQIEHVIMLEYLYAMFSIKDRYLGVRGVMAPILYSPLEPPAEAMTLLGVSNEEMHHLDFVSTYLAAIGQPPNLIVPAFPFSTGIYPFPLDLQPLSLRSCARYLWAEADHCSLNLSPRCPHTPEEEQFILRVYAELFGPPAEPPMSYIGSLYRTIMRVTEEVAQAPPPFLAAHVDWNYWWNLMLEIVAQGEIEHFRYFKLVFEGTHPGFAPYGPEVWKVPNDDEIYPSIQFHRDQRTAYPGQRFSIRNGPDRLRDVAWLSDLHYWIILALLDTSYRYGSRKLLYKSVANMTEALYALGTHLAHHRIGVPFDQPALPSDLGRTVHDALATIRKLVLEAQTRAEALRDFLPPHFNFNVYPETLKGLMRPGDDAAM